MSYLFKSFIGGYADNNYLDDTWYFNISAARWLQKEKFVF
jgi:hypothetical protein